MRAPLLSPSELFGGPFLAILRPRFFEDAASALAFGRWG